MHDAELESLIVHISELVERFQDHPDEEVREAVFELLQAVDALHREALSRLVGVLRAAGHGKLLKRAGEDPAVAMLMQLYELLPEEGGPQRRRGFVPLESLGVGRVGGEERWAEVMPAAEVPEAEMVGAEVDDVRLLLLRHDGEIRAFANVCATSILPLDGGSLEDGAIHCPWHGCRYAAATGRRLDRREGGLDSFPVEVRDGMVMVAVNRPSPAPLPLGREAASPAATEERP